MRRHYIKAVYGPSTGKTLHNLLKQELVTNFGYEDKLKIADVLIDSFLEIIRDYGRDKGQLFPYQILWLAVDKDDFPGYGKSMDKTRHKVVILTLWESDELEAMANGVSRPIVLKSRIARLCEQAYQQGALLSMTDLSLLLGINHSYAAKLRQEWEKEHNQVLKTRGSYHDLGGGLTHKRMIIQDHLEGLNPSEIARKQKHDLSAINRYIKDFERTLPLFEENISVSKIAFYTGMSLKLVKEYRELYVEFYQNKMNKTKKK